MKTMKTVTKEIICNKCGLSCKKSNDCNDFYGLIESSVTGGYFSDFLEDDIKYTFSLCEKCLSEIFTAFKEPPQTIKCFTERQLPSP